MPSNADVSRRNVIITTAKCKKKQRNNARYILQKKCTNMHENEADADQLCGNSVTYQRLCSLFLNPVFSTLENR